MTRIGRYGTGAVRQARRGRTPLVPFFVGAVWLFSIETASATTGISALGAVRDLFVVLLLAAGAVILIVTALANSGSRRADHRSPGLALLLVAAGFSFVASFMALVDRPGKLQLALGVEVLVLLALLSWTYLATAVSRAIALGGIVALVLLVNGVEPRLVDLRRRVYVDNSSALGAGNFTRPGHWRVMVLPDGRRFVRLKRIQLDRERDDPLVLVEDAAGRVTLRHLRPVPEAIYRPRARFVLPILGTASVDIYDPDTYEEEPVRLLDGKATLESRLLHEVVSETWETTSGSVQQAWAEELLDRSCDPNYFDKSSRTSVLEEAIRKDNLTAARLLLAQGASPNLVDPYGGGTALHYAVERGNRRMVELLLANGARVRVKDRQGRTPLDLAEIQSRLKSSGTPGHGETLEILRLLQPTGR